MNVNYVNLNNDCHHIIQLVSDVLMLHYMHGKIKLDVELIAFNQNNGDLCVSLKHKNKNTHSIIELYAAVSFTSENFIFTKI